jgi:glycosyltransferase involved in cell wall biosynthesis
MTANEIKISLVICTYNRCRYLPEALESVSRQELPAALFELIIVDNNSTDDTAIISQTFIDANPTLNVRYCFEVNKGLSHARNRGIAEARSSIVNYVDDDAILDASYLQQMLHFFETYPTAAGAGGKVVPKYEDGKEPMWMNKYLNGFIGKVDHGNNILLFSGDMKYPVGCNMAWRKELLEKCGGFNTNLQFRSDDKYIYHQVIKLNSAVYYVPAAWLYHYIDAHRLELNNFKKLFLKTGNEEKIRVQSEGGSVAVVKKGIEFLFKTGAALALFLLFTLKGQYLKGKYVLISQYCTLKGFLKESVFVR